MRMVISCKDEYQGLSNLSIVLIDLIIMSRFRTLNFTVFDEEGKETV
jgi:hypothetical protein